MHFFTELTIPGQTTTPSVIPYGPQAGLEESSFITYSAFDPAAATKIFACQSGMLFIQDSLFPGTVNIIIKPTVQLEIAHTGVKYYVYRGVKKTGFVTGPDVTPTGLAESEFIINLWADLDTVRIQIPATPDPTPESIGLEVALLGDVHVEDVFNNSQAVARPVLVQEGEWIGEFSDTVPVSFEIITDSDHLPVDLDFLRNTSSGVSATMTTPVTDEQIFDDKNDREQILAFIDPAAFFGMHWKQGIKVSEYTPGKMTTTKKKDDLYNDVLSLFTTKNRVYIDIRGEYGYSYNYYNDYGGGGNDLIKIKDHVTTNLVDNIYFTHKWPIYYTDLPQSQDSVSKTEIQLRIDDNIKPLLFFRNKKLIRQIAHPNFVNEKKLLDGSNVDWSKTVKLRYPNMDDGGSKVNVPWYIQMQYFRQDYSTVDTNRILFPYDINDRLFANIDLPQNVSNIDIFQHVLAYKYTLVAGEEFAYVGRPGVYADTNEVVFYTEPEFPYERSREKYPKPSKLKKAKRSNPTDSPVFNEDIKLHRVKIIDTDFPAPPPADSQDVFVLGVSNVNRNGTTSRKEDFFMLGITAAEFNTIVGIADTEGLSKKHIRKIIFPDGALGGLIEPVGGIPYYKYELNIHGYDSDGYTDSTELVGTGIYVYSLDGRAFNSRDFGAQSSVLPGLPDPGTLAPWKHIHKWNYNKNDSNVQNIHGTGFDNIQDVSNSQGVNPAITEIRGRTFYPTNSFIGGVSSIPSPRPAIFIVHGNGQDYEEYEELSKHLARNGFITTSISCLFDSSELKLEDDNMAAYAPITHLFRANGNLYFYNDTMGNPEYQKIRLYTGTTTDSATINDHTEIVKRWKYGVNEDFTVNAAKDAITFTKKSFRYLQGMAGVGRANLLYEHMRVVKDKFGNKMQNNIGLLGHSRGAESVVIAANEILDALSAAYNLLQPIGIENVRSVISLAPTHQYTQVSRRLERDIPYMVVYGSRDYDVAGAYATDPSAIYSSYKYMATGISLYDRSYSAGQEKSMVFVHGATHNGFITSNDKDLNSANSKGYAFPAAFIESVSAQQNISLAYFNAQFRRTLYDESYWIDYMNGDLVPESVETEREKLLIQHEPVALDNLLIHSPSSTFNGAAIGLAPTFTGGAMNMTSGDLRENDGIVTADLRNEGTSPNYSDGITLEWGAGNILEFGFAINNVSAYEHVSLRIGNAERGVPLVGLKIGLRSAGIIRSIEVRTLASPDVHTDTIRNHALLGDRNMDSTKIPMQTIRIPLEKFVQAGLVLNTVDAVQVIFPAGVAPRRKATIDNVQFTK